MTWRLPSTLTEGTAQGSPTVLESDFMHAAAFQTARAFTVTSTLPRMARE
jgi:hypothetical protein